MLETRFGCTSVAIRSATDSVTFRTTGGNPLGPEGVLAGSVQFTAQHKRAALAAGDRSRLIAFLQQLDILPWSPEWSGIPAATPPAIARSKRMDVNRFFTFELSSHLPIYCVGTLSLNIPWNKSLANCIPSNPFGDENRLLIGCGRGSCTSPTHER